MLLLLSPCCFLPPLPIVRLDSKKFGFWNLDAAVNEGSGLGWGVGPAFSAMSSFLASWKRSWWPICRAVVQIPLLISLIILKIQFKKLLLWPRNYNRMKPTKTGKFTLNFWDESQFSTTCCNCIIYVLIYWLHWHLEFPIPAQGPVAAHVRSTVRVSALLWRPYETQQRH